jgi:hypothetical protein
MISSSTTKVPKSLTHPPGFRSQPEASGNLGRSAKLFASHDKAIIGHKVRLIDRIAEGNLDKETFLRNVGHLESFESLRAELRGQGGLTRRESFTLISEMKKLAGKMNALPHHQSEPSQPIATQALGLLYDEVASGLISKTDAVEELQWRSMQRYGQAVAQRPGPVYSDERPKLRAALATPQTPQSSNAGSPAPFHRGTLNLIRQTISIFPQLDLDGNGLVDRTEARSILTNHHNLGLTASQAATLYSRQAVLADVVDPGPASHEMMGLEDLQGLLPENNGLVSQDRANQAISLLSSRLADQERRTVSKEMPLYLGDSPDGSKVAQGLEGSCWFLGTLPAIDSETLKTLLVQEGDHYRMNFADGTSEYVAPLNEAERRVYSRGDGTWSGLMEKGLAQKLGKTGQDIKGGLTQDALRLLTGAECEVSFLGYAPLGAEPDYRDRKNLGQLLQSTLQAGGAAFTQASAADFDPQISLVSEPKHAYTITGYDPVTEMVELRNPWGKGEKADKDGVDDGNFALSLTEVAATFSLVITEKTGQA